MELELQEMMTQRVRLFRKTGTDRYGKDVYEPEPVVAFCHIDGRTREVLRKDGSTAAAQGRIYLRDIYPWLDESVNLYVPSLRPQDEGWRWAELLGIDLLHDEDGPYAQVINYGDK